MELGAYETPIDKMLSLRPERAILELVPEQGAEPRPTDYRAPSKGHLTSTYAGQL